MADFVVVQKALDRRAPLVKTGDIVTFTYSSHNAETKKEIESLSSPKVYCLGDKDRGFSKGL